MKTKALYPLLRSTAHAISWRPMVLGAVLGAAVLLIPEALTTRLTETHLTTLARIAAVCGALGAAFLLDDPAASGAPTLPTSRLARNLVRVALAGPALALWWMLAVGLAKTFGHQTGAQLPVAGLTLEAATLLAVALALAAVAQRRTSDGNTGVIAAPAVLLLAAVAWFLPSSAALILAPTNPHWAASHYRWVAVLGTALVAFGWAGLERERRRLPRGRRLAVIVVVVLLVSAGTAFAFYRASDQRTAAPSEGAQSGAWPDNPDFNARILGNAWGAYQAAPAWAVAGLTNRTWGIPRFWVQAARHAPGLVLSRFDSAFDPHAAVEVTKWMPQNPPNLLAVIDANETAIEAAGVTLHSYTAPGTGHGLFEFDRFYHLKVRDVRLIDWLEQLLAGKPPGDVHCDSCNH